MISRPTGPQRKDVLFDEAASAFVTPPALFVYNIGYLRHLYNRFYSRGIGTDQLHHFPPVMLDPANWRLVHPFSDYITPEQAFEEYNGKQSGGGTDTYVNYSFAAALRIFLFHLGDRVFPFGRISHLGLLS
jgi:hypothetical protein